MPHPVVTITLAVTLDEADHIHRALSHVINEVFDRDDETPQSAAEKALARMANAIASAADMGPGRSFYLDS